MCKKVEIPVETLENWQIFSFILCTSSDKKSISEFVMGFFIIERLILTKNRLGVRLQEHMARSVINQPAMNLTPKMATYGY